MIKPLISIIVPVYNSAQWLTRCIESIINQKYSNIEILLINDGSTDDSIEICDKFKKKDNRITIIDKKNNGVSSTRNKGIEEALGKYIIFVDSDDYIEQNMITELYKEITHCDLCTCNYYTIINNQKNAKSTIKSYSCSKNHLDKYIETMQKDMLFNSPCNKIYKTSIIKENNIRFHNNIQMGEDYLFNIEYIKYVSEAIYINKPLYNYDLKNGSLSRKYIERNIDNEFLIIDTLKELYESNQYDMSFIQNEYIELLKSNIYNMQIGNKSKKNILNLIKEYSERINNKKLENKIYISKLSKENRFIFKMIVQKKYKKIYNYFSLRYIIKKIYKRITNKPI